MANSAESLNPGLFAEKEARIEKVVWLIETVAAERNGSGALSTRDFYEHGLANLHYIYYSDSVYNAVKDLPADIELRDGSRPGMVPFFYVDQLSKGFFCDKESRMKAVEYVISVTRKEPTDILSTDFGHNGLGSLMTYFVGLRVTSPTHSAVSEFLAERGVTIYPWQMSNAPNDLFEKEPELVHIALEWLRRETGRARPAQQDFANHNLSRLWTMLRTN